MRELVDDDRIQHLGWCEDETPAERERAGPRGAPPARPLVPDGDPRRPDAQRRRERRRTVGDDRVGPIAHPGSQQRRGVAAIAPEPDDEPSLPSRRRLGDLHAPAGRTVAARIDGAHPELQTRDHQDRPLLEWRPFVEPSPGGPGGGDVPLDPPGMRLHERGRRGQRRTAGQDDHGLALLGDGQARVAGPVRPPDPVRMSAHDDARSRVASARSSAAWTDRCRAMSGSMLSKRSASPGRSWPSAGRSAAMTTAGTG